MQESEIGFHEIEWPAPDTAVAGPLVWLRGWVVGKPGYDFTDVRVVSPAGIHLAVLGLPRPDLAAHFKSARRWLPSEFVVGVPATVTGRTEYSIEAMDEYGNWHRLRNLAVQVNSAGENSPRIEGHVILQPGESATGRTPHLPFHGHLDLPEAGAPMRFGRVAVFGWLLHETQTIRSVFATVNGLVFNTLESGLTDESLAIKLPQHQNARHARLRGEVDVPPTVASPACLRVYAELADGTVALCFAQRIAIGTAPFTPDRIPAIPLDASGKKLPALPSGRPRRLLIATKTLQPDEGTLRALDVVRHLIASNRWAVRLVVSEDGPLHSAFEAAECAVQIIDPAAYFAARDETAIDRTLSTLERQIWWRHLDAVAIFDSSCTWAERLAQRKRLPVFADPADDLLWFSPEPIFSADAKAPLSAPIRGLSDHGAGVLLHAADQLTRRHGKSIATRKIILTDVRNTTEERLFKADARLATGIGPDIRPPFAATAAIVCPAFAGHPHRALLSAAAAGVPLITTPTPALTRVFGPNDVNFVSPGNPLALAHAIADLLANPSTNERRAAAAARITEANFAPARQLARWQELLESVVAG